MRCASPAMAAAVKGYRCIFVLPDKMSSEKIRLLAAYGAATRGQAGTEPTGVPIDLVWGLVLLAFGLLAYSLYSFARKPLEGPAATEPRN